MSSLKPFGGPTKKLVLALDVGTTFSGVAYVVFEPGKVPAIQGVTRYPGLPKCDFKIPSVLWYTLDGEVHSAGAETPGSPVALEGEEEKHLFCVQWFKLWLRPSSLPSDGLRTADLMPLPPGKSIVHVFGDFLKYLFNCTKRFIVESHISGDTLWESMEDHIDFVLSHPNGWGDSQQGKMRLAAIHAGLIPDTPAGRERVHFVTEGEASLLYCLENDICSEAIRPDSTVMVIDAGGGTVDLSTYKFTSVDPITVEEIAPSDCIFQGSIRVNLRAAEYLKAKLANSRYNDDDMLQALMEIFEKSTKPTFGDSSIPSYLRFGLKKDNDPLFGIKNGRLALEGSQMAAFFEPSITSISASVQSQLQTASEPVTVAFLVGGFAANTWLYNRLYDLLQYTGIALSLPDGHTNKAVATGSVLSFLRVHEVAVRVARLTYGTRCTVAFEPSNPDHALRQNRVFTRCTGISALGNYFDVLLQRGTRVTGDTQFKCPFVYESEDLHDLDRISDTILCYRGIDKAPNWLDIRTDRFSRLCTIHADMSGANRQRIIGPNGPYYRQKLEVILLFGLVETKAQLCWMENGVEKRGPVSIVFDDDTETAP